MRPQLESELCTSDWLAGMADSIALAGWDDGMLCAWDVLSATQLWRLELADSVGLLAVSPCTLVTTNALRGGCEFWDFTPKALDALQVSDVDSTNAINT